MKCNLKTALLSLFMTISCWDSIAQPSKLLAKIPFELNNGAIILAVRINNSSRVLKLLFDTGADGMALPQDIADSLGLKESRRQNASVVGGNMQISVSENNEVHIGAFNLHHQNIAFFKDMRKGTDGIIGNIITKQYITKVDFDRQELSLYSFGDYQHDDKGISVPVKVKGVFIIPGSIAIAAEEPINGNFVFDTGASYNLICFRPFVKQNRLLVGGFKAEYSASTTSMGVSTPTFTGNASSFRFADMPSVKNFPVTLMAGGGQAESWSPGVDGSIGIRLISRYNFTINAAKGEIHLTPNKSFDFPNDFVLGGYLLGFDPSGTLGVISKIDYAIENGDIPPGSVILSINGFKSKVIKDNKNMQQLKDVSAANKIDIEYVKDGKKQMATIPKTK